ncbi:hypothetical protein GWG54_16670 [Natronococcus sp. JC468]|uniref:hypothetical protein n=1 Tax=Natronococcus sp. JC468 TaxID=1961921 RepID=UPI00143C2677|nr:hypothetical protein [Natronococcus sp. JC468]NKE37415.1 hypothetical protein [Natronococcus sp. JC468]
MDADLADWIAELREHARTHPARAPLYLLFTAYLSVWYAITSRVPLGRNVYDSDWDLLVVLDACRVDTLREVAPEYEFIDEVDEAYSVGSQSAEWMANTFTESRREEIGRTAYVSGNGFSETVFVDGQYPPVNNAVPIDLSSWSVVDESAFGAHRTVWETDHDEAYGSVLPAAMTDHAIDAGRNGDADRIIVHYTQPHLPYAGAAYREGREPTEVERRGYELLEEGAATREAVYEAYRETLRWVLDDVAELLENVDAEDVVITSDHGEAFGEWRAYGHPEGFPHPAVKKVPWVETTATDEGTREPDLEAGSSVDTDIQEHLRDLGYR